MCATTDVDIAAIGAALLLIAGEVLVLTAVALLFSSFSTPFLTGALTLGVACGDGDPEGSAPAASGTTPAPARRAAAIAWLAPLPPPPV